MDQPKHYYRYGYQRDANAGTDQPQRWVDHCGECDRPKSEPIHFCQPAN
ncbi:hypothetical protein [Streptomyces albidoflavus]|nr:hypothetical protein [Streptomyces albidoflavus]